MGLSRSGLASSQSFQPKSIVLVPAGTPNKQSMTLIQYDYPSSLFKQQLTQIQSKQTMPQLESTRQPTYTCPDQSYSLQYISKDQKLGRTP